MYAASQDLGDTMNQGPMPQEGAPLAIAVKDLLASPKVGCEKCGRLLCQPIFEIRIVSGLLNPTGQEVVVPQQVGWKCAFKKCGKIWKKFEPVTNLIDMRKKRIKGGKSK